MYFWWNAWFEVAQFVEGVHRVGKGNTRVFVAVQEKHRDVKQVAHGQLHPTGRVHASTHERGDGRPALGPTSAELESGSASIAEARQVNAVGIDVIAAQDFQQ